jgi:hypothetical protein
VSVILCVSEYGQKTNPMLVVSHNHRFEQGTCIKGLPFFRQRSSFMTVSPMVEWLNRNFLHELYIAEVMLGAAILRRPHLTWSRLTFTSVVFLMSKKFTTLCPYLVRLSPPRAFPHITQFQLLDPRISGASNVVLGIRCSRFLMNTKNKMTRLVDV